MNTRCLWLRGLVLILVLLGVAPAARASVPDGAVDPPPEAITDPAVLAANRLMALPWAGLSRQAEGDAEEAIVRGLEDQDLANDHGGGTLNWRFRMWVKNAGADVDIASPPGFSAASLTGFTLEAPLEGGWSFKVRGTLKANARVRVGGETIFSVSPSVPFGLRVWDVKLTTRAQLDPTDQTRPGPRVVNATVNARLKLGGDGAIPISIPVSITVRIDPSDGSLTLRGPFQAFDIGDDFGILEARLGGDLIMRFTGSGDPGSEVSPLDRMTLRLTGRLSIKLKRVGKVSVPFSLTLPTVHVPAPDILQPLAGGLPRTWGQGHPRGTTPPPPTGADYATPALQLEQAIVPHIPYGGVFAIDVTPIRGPQIAERRSFGVEADSAIWTGHYLAAEAFRYAATSDPAALERLKFVLAGVQRLFDVTQDAVVRRNAAGARKRSAVQITGIFARAALQVTDKVTAGPLSDRDCYYEAPEGGWDVTPRIGKTRRFAKYRDIPAFLLRGAIIRPVGTVWYGFGCGHVGGPDKDHPVSRDQYSGIVMGLGYARALVSDPDVQRITGELIEKALHHLVIEGQWNVILPPEGRIPVGSTFLGNQEKQLAFLLIGRSVNPAKYGPLYDQVKAAASLVWLPVWMSLADPIPKYYKFNLEHAGGVVPALVFETDPGRRAAYMVAYDMLRKATRHHKNAYFNLARILIEPPARRPVVAQEPSGSNPAITLAQEIRSLLSEYLERRTLLIGTGTGLPRNQIADPGFQVGVWPGDVALYTSLNLQEGGTGRSYEVRFAMPMKARVGNGIDFAWQRSPFGYALKPGSSTCGKPPTVEKVRTCGSAPRREGPGVDYLLAYWLGRYLGVVP